MSNLIESVLEGEYLKDDCNLSEKDRFLNKEISSMQKVITYIKKVEKETKEINMLFKDVYKNIYNPYFDIRTINLSHDDKIYFVERFKEEIELIDSLTDWHKKLLLLFGYKTPFYLFSDDDKKVEEYSDKLLEFSSVFISFKNKRYAYLLSAKGYNIEEILQS